MCYFDIRFIFCWINNMVLFILAILLQLWYIEIIYNNCNNCSILVLIDFMFFVISRKGFGCNYPNKKRFLKLTYILFIINVLFANLILKYSSISPPLFIVYHKYAVGLLKRSKCPQCCQPPKCVAAYWVRGIAPQGRKRGENALPIL